MNLQTEEGAAIETRISSFDKRQKPVEKNLTGLNEPPSLTLDELGIIQDCSPSIEMLFGYRRSELVLHHVSMLFPQLTAVELVQTGQINPLLNYLYRCGHFFQTQNRQGEIFSSNLCFAFVGYDGSRSLKMFVRPAGMEGT